MQTNDRIAAVAAAQFHEHGITSTGVDALSRAAGISKRTLYERFGSKDGLIVAAYGVARHPGVPDVHRGGGGGGGHAAWTARGAVRPAGGDGRDARVPRLPFANAAAELADLDHPAHQVVRAHKQRIHEWMEERARLAGAADPDALSRKLMLVFAGAQSQALVERSPRPAADARLLAGELLDAGLRTT